MDVCGPFASAPRSVGLGAALALAVGLGTPGPGQAQIVRDGTVGPAGSLAGPNYTIPHTDGTRVGGNLFHSFGRFNIRTGESATFTGPNEISHVISRVTGGERSTIDGLLRSQVGKATFWFLNPAGVLFGPNARLDVPAAFHVSTADEVRFADGAKFSASDPAASRLTVAPPEAFGFLRPNPAGIAVNSSQLETQARQTLSVVGGDLQVTGGTLVSAGGQVNIVAMAGPGTVQATTGASTAPAHGAVRLAQNAQVDTSGNGGGQITIYGGQIEVAGSSVLTENTGAQDAKGGITVAGDAVRVADGGKISSSTRARGSAGRVAVTGRELNVRNGGLINSNTFTQGDAGTVSVTTGDLAVSNGGVISSATFAQGNAGRVTIHADRLLVSGDGAQPFTGLSSSTSGQGRAGTVTVQADRLLVSGDDAQPFTGLSSEATDGSAGPAGAVTVTGHAIAVRNGGRISTTSDSPQSAGNVTITADGSLSLAGDARIASSATQADAGRIITRAKDSLTMTGSSITTEARRGKGGGISLSAGRLALVSQSEISSSVLGGLSSSNAGDITIDPRFVVLDRSQILANAAGGGRNGNIRIIADIFIRSSDSMVAATGELAISGMIEPSNMITPLDIKCIDATSLLPAACAARLGESKDSLRAAVHATILPVDPDRPLLPSSLNYTGHQPPNRAAPSGNGAAEEGAQEGGLEPVPAGVGRLSFACAI